MPKKMKAWTVKTSLGSSSTVMRWDSLAILFLLRLLIADFILYFLLHVLISVLICYSLIPSPLWHIKNIHLDNQKQILPNFCIIFMLSKKNSQTNQDDIQEVNIYNNLALFRVWFLVVYLETQNWIEHVCSASLGFSIFIWKIIFILYFVKRRVRCACVDNLISVGD